MKTIINRMALGVFTVIIALFSADKAYLGYWYIGIIPCISLAIVSNYINTLEKNDEIGKKVKIISWICFFASAILGLLLIASFPEIFNTYHL